MFENHSAHVRIVVSNMRCQKAEEAVVNLIRDLQKDLDDTLSALSFDVEIKVDSEE